MNPDEGHPPRHPPKPQIRFRVDQDVDRRFKRGPRHADAFVSSLKLPDEQVGELHLVVNLVEVAGADRLAR